MIPSSIYTGWQQCSWRLGWANYDMMSGIERLKVETRHIQYKQ